MKAAQDPRAAAFVPEEKADAIVRLPPIRVRTGASEIAGFLRETADTRTGVVPVTFPARWLALPVLRGLILQLIGGDDFLPVHEGQSFVYEHELQIETDYILAVEARRTAKPPRLTLKIAVATEQAEICAHLETVLRIVPLDSGSAS